MGSANFGVSGVIQTGGQIINQAVPVALRTLGYSEAEILGQHFRVIFTPEDVEARQADQEMRTAAAEGRALDERSVHVVTKAVVNGDRRRVCGLRGTQTSSACAQGSGLRDRSP